VIFFVGIGTILANVSKSVLKRASTRLFLQIDIIKIAIHEVDEADAVVNFLDSNGLTSQTGAETDLLAI